MSAAIRIARLKAEYRGDPGLFDFIGKAVGGIAKVAGNFLPGPIGTIAKVAGNLLAPAPKAIAQTLPMSTAGKPLNPSLFPVVQRSLPQIPVQVDSTRTSGVSLFPGGPMVGTQTTYTSPAGAHPGQGCGAGYHMNKAGYYTRQGYVAPGTRCVKNRKRNPLNPRAASRAMSRLTSAKKATRSILKFFGDGKRRAAPAALNGRRKCGCK